MSDIAIRVENLSKRYPSIVLRAGRIGGPQARAKALRDETEWVETVEAGWNVLVGVDTARIVQAIYSFSPPAARPALYGDGQAAERVAALLDAKQQPTSKPQQRGGGKEGAGQSESKKDAARMYEG